MEKQRREIGHTLGNRMTAEREAGDATIKVNALADMGPSSNASLQDPQNCRGREQAA